MKKCFDCVSGREAINLLAFSGEKRKRRPRGAAEDLRSVLNKGY